MKIFQRPHILSHAKDSEYLALNWKHIDQAVSIWVNAIQTLPEFDTILVMVRGGLIPATVLSHRLKVRQMKFFQGRRTASDVPHDYCSFSIISLPDIREKERVLIVEDIVYRGETIAKAIEYVKSTGGAIAAICTLVLDEEYEDKLKNSDLLLIPAYQCTAGKWIRFPWEKPLQDEIVPEVIND